MPTNARFYNDPINAVPSDIGEQIVEEAYWRKAIKDAMRDQYFMPLAEVRDMPRNSGKTMKANVYIPILDDRNISDEGIDATGLTLDATRAYAFVDGAVASIGWTGAAADGSFVDVATAEAAPEFTPGDTVTLGFANLYGGSRDVGAITAKLPVLGEGAKRVNRVGATRLVVEGSLEQFGFFNEYTEESVNFDTDAELNQHVADEMLKAANEATEDTLQRDLLNSAGTVRFPGAIATIATVDTTPLTYEDFIRLSITLDLNRTPKHTSIITGSRMVDTRTINSARIMYVSPEMTVTLETLENLQNEKALIDVRHYEGQTHTMNGEIGSIHNFRIVVNPEMAVYTGGGAAAGVGTHYETGGNIDVQPMLVVGDDSFSTIGFMSDGKKRNTKFTINHVRPGPASVTLENPYGNMGLMSIRWWYGFLLKRPERLAVMYSSALL